MTDLKFLLIIELMVRCGSIVTKNYSINYQKGTLKSFYEPPMTIIIDRMPRCG